MDEGEKRLFTAENTIFDMLGHPGYVEMKPEEYCRFALKTAISLLGENEPRRQRLESELGRTEVEAEDGIINPRGQSERIYQALSSIVSVVDDAHTKHASKILEDNIDHHDLQHGDEWLFGLETVSHLLEDKIIIAGTRSVMRAQIESGSRQYPIPLARETI